MLLQDKPDRVDEFRANGGVVGGTYAKVPLLLLHHTGAKSGAEHITPLAYLADGENWVTFAANSGRPTHPGWYYNLYDPGRRRRTRVGHL